MSLVGNLEDLSLGDLLQIVSMSQKSGVLALKATAGTGQIVFRAGLVHAARIKCISADLRGIVLAAGLCEAARFDAANAAIASRTDRTPARLAAALGLDPEQVEGLIRQAVEAAIFEMFTWLSGEFSFDARRDVEDDTELPVLQTGINPQFLAMEGMRLLDERARSGSSPAPAAARTQAETSDDIFFGTEPLEIDEHPGEGIDLDLDLGPAVAASPRGRSGAVELVAARAVSQVDAEASPAEALVTEAALSNPVVVIDPDIAALEWIKGAIEGRFERVHTFARADQGLARIRQYLIRGELPIVLISPAAPIDSLSGIHGLMDFVKRLRKQAPRIVVAGLCEEDVERPGAPPAQLDGMLPRPTRKRIAAASAAEALAQAERFQQSLAGVLAQRRAGASSPSPADAAAGGAAGPGGSSPPARGGVATRRPRGSHD